MDPENSVRGDFFSHRSVSQRIIQTSLEKQLDPRGPIASWGGIYISISKENYSHKFIEVYLYYSTYPALKGIAYYGPAIPVGVVVSKEWCISLPEPRRMKRISIVLYISVIKYVVIKTIVCFD